MKLLLFGTSDFSKPIFEALKKKGYSPILWDLNKKSFEDFQRLNPHLCIVAAYGKIIPKEYLEVPKYGFLNVHPSLLPKYRGPSPIQMAILNGDKETGVTIIKMDEQIDHGEIVISVKYQVYVLESYSTIKHKLADLGAQLLIETLPKWVNGEIKPIPQNHSEATYTKKFSWQDGKISWSKSADEIDRQIRALNPEPGVWTHWRGKLLKILAANADKYAEIDAEVGKILQINKKVAVKCGKGNLILKEVQLEGKEQNRIEDFLRGRRDFINSALS